MGWGEAKFYIFIYPVKLLKTIKVNVFHQI